MTMFDTILGIYFYCISGYDLAKKIRIKVVFNYLYIVGDNVKSNQNSSAKRALSEEVSWYKTLGSNLGIVAVWEFQLQ